MTWIVIGLLALAGFQLGGVIPAWRTSRPLAVVLALARQSRRAR